MKMKKFLPVAKRRCIGFAVSGLGAAPAAGIAGALRCGLVAFAWAVGVGAPCLAAAQGETGIAIFDASGRTVQEMIMFVFFKSMLQRRARNELAHHL